MKLKLPITFLLCLCAATLSPVHAGDSYLSFEDHVITSFKASVNCVEQVGLDGPIAQEVTRWAIVRQLHENGLDRPATYCIPGISCGGWNKEMLEYSLRIIPNELAISRIYDSEGLPMYVLKGNKANLVSTATVALLFDYYVTNLSWFSKQEKEAWSDSKRYSYLISQGFNFPEYRTAFAELKEARQKILRKCNGGYGPGRERISGEVKKLDDLFDRLLEANN